ncbi:PRC-barrel domain-containing protein [Reyranella sp.]|jgi:hypothetical protein|uniref:PRC-barrel domain-containing protein n=1 Tax=Reyranella sp. TaxID=1929291 RepID=UPI002F93C72D
MFAVATATGSTLAQSPPPSSAPAPPDASTAPAPDSSTTQAPAAPAVPSDTPAPAPASTPTPPAKPSDSASSPPSVTVIGSREVQGILGNEVRSQNNESMGRIVDVIVDGEGKPRAAIIDFGGFLGVGSRKIAVDWKALHFVPAASKRYSIALALTREQVKAAPEYKEGQPIVILGASGSLEPIP